MSDYDDDRPNWREIDRKREKSRFYGRQEKPDKDGDRTQEGPKNRWQAGRVEEAIERIFLGKKGTLDHDKTFRKLHQSYGSSTFAKKAASYVQEYGLPDDVPTLLMFLDSKDEAITLNAIDELSRIYGTLQQRQKDDIKSRFSIVAMTDRSKKVRSKIEAVMEELD